MSFADLDPLPPVERRAGRRVQRLGRPRVVFSAEDAPPPTAAGRALAAARRSIAALRPLRARVGRGSAAAWRAAKPVLDVARETTSHLVRVGVARFVAGLPAERPDRRTIVAVVTSLIVLTGLSAGVVASRDGGSSRGLSVATAASVVPLPALPSLRAASPAPAAAPAHEPDPAVFAPALPAGVSVLGTAPSSPTAPARVASPPQHLHKHAAIVRTVASAHPVPAKAALGKPVAVKPALAKAASGPAVAKPAATSTSGKPAVIAAPGKPAVIATSAKPAVIAAPGKPVATATPKVAASSSTAQPVPAKPAAAVKPALFRR